MTKLQTPSQITSWYHSQILRIPHGKQTQTKRYLTDEQVVGLFEGTVVIQEKVDGKMSWRCQDGRHGQAITIFEDMTGKHSVHDHVMKYDDLPSNKQIVVEHIINFFDTDGFDIKGFFTPLTYVTMKFETLPTGLPNIYPTIEQIHQILGAVAQSPSHFGAPVIEGLVIKNYEKQLFGKWINDEFEDKLHV